MVAMLGIAEWDGASSALQLSGWAVTTIDVGVTAKGRPLRTFHVVKTARLRPPARCSDACASSGFFANVHEDDGMPIYGGRSPFHPFICPATLSEIRLFEAQQAELARWEDENGRLVDMPETMRDGCRACILIDVFDLPDDNEVLF